MTGQWKFSHIISLSLIGLIFIAAIISIMGPSNTLMSDSVVETSMKAISTQGAL
jgi:hypothetical protein